VAQGYGINRRVVLHNDFVIAGPPGDPARIKELKSSVDAFKKIAGTQALFMSRGDNSGTQVKEKAIWKAAGINPEGRKWYHETGLGMGQKLNVASEKNAYTLTDRGTYLALKKSLGLIIVTEGDPVLLNIYHVIEVNPEKWPKVSAAGSRAFADFLVSQEAQSIIKVFGVDKFGMPLFFPDAGKKED